MTRAAGALFALALLLGIAVGVLAPRWRAWLDGGAGPLTLLTADPACRPLGAPCAAADRDLGITVRLGQSVRPLVAFPVEVRLSGPAAAAVRGVEAHFAMVDMDMGLTRFALTPLPDGSWHGQALLPVCSNGRSDWQLRLRVQTAEGRYEAGFPFQTER